MAKSRKTVQPQSKRREKAYTSVGRSQVSDTTPLNIDRGVAVVTGGAGSMGTTICQALAREGMRVVVGYNRSAEKAKSLATTLPGDGHAALPASVTDSAALAGLAAEIERRYGVCDVLVNCAGVTRFVPHGDLDALDDALIENILSTNVRGPFATVRALRPLLEKSKHPGGAVIINISSIAALTAMGSNVIYCASKAAVDNMTKSLARALAPRIRVVSIAPGVVDNAFIRSMDQRWLEEQVGRTPLRRLAAPEEVASAVIAAIKHLTFTTGAIIPVDGGRPLS
ncbi:MAG TPA: SDR family oxidoreductase [Candidatus Acidoferrales bacterium]|nr:SDR family oxidoreductase [Candidatus Acidoferrales bacterium]